MKGRCKIIWITLTTKTKQAIPIVLKMQTTVITAVMPKILEAAKQAIPKISVNPIPLQKAVANFVHQKTPEPLRCFFLTWFIRSRQYSLFHLIVAILFPLTGYHPITVSIKRKLYLPCYQKYENCLSGLIEIRNKSSTLYTFNSFFTFSRKINLYHILLQI